MGDRPRKSDFTERSRWRRSLWQGLALLAFAAVPAGLCQLTAARPRDRYIHMEAFRYGKDPSVISVNRGDRLHLTFSTRDAGHSFFLEEFDVDAKISPGSKEVTVFRPSNPVAPPVYQREVTFVAEHPGWLKWLVSKSQYRCHVWCGPMHAFEHGNLIIAPNTLLWAGLGLIVGIAAIGLLELRGTLRQASAAPPLAMPTDGVDLFRRAPWLKRLMKQRGFQFVFVAICMALLYVIVLTTLLGTRVSGRNLGIMLLWVAWLFFLATVLTPLGGRLWCLACPLPLFGEAIQRRALIGVREGHTGPYHNQFFGLNRRWPSWLANAWPRTFALLGLGTFSALLVANPRVSAWATISMVLLATGMSLIWELRAFCRYICPVNAFVSLYGMCGKLALRCKDKAVCDRCRLRTCQRGDKRGWACPYGLCVAEINENNDCGLCTECIKSCAYDNVTLRWRPYAHDLRVRGMDEAFLAMAMLTLAIAYCVTHLGHWPFIRDCVNIMDKGNWGLFGMYAAVLWTIALGILPGIMFLTAGLGKRLAGAQQKVAPVLSASTGALVPIGLMIWIAFVVPMLFVNVTFLAQSLSDPFGWGWNFLGFRSMPWHQLWPRAVPWIQVGFVLIGLGYSLRNAWRIWLGITQQPSAALKGMLPLAALLLCFAGWLVWFFAN